MYLKLLNPYSYRLNNNRVNRTRVIRGHVVDRLASYRGVEVFRESKNHFLYVVDGVIIAEIAGFSEGFKGLIDDFRDKTTLHQSSALHAHERMNWALDTGKSLIESGQAKL